MDPAGSAEATNGEQQLIAVRDRLAVAMLVPFVALMALAAIQAFWASTGTSQGTAIGLLFAGGIGLPVLGALLARRVLGLVAALDSERAQLAELYSRARLDSLRDALTGLGNHRAFQEELARQLDLARRHGTPIALLLVDVDDLKKVNDERGHAAGDALLSAMGRIAGAVLRRSDRAFRIGGDEFAVLLTQSDAETGLAVARRMLASALGGGDPSRPVTPFSLSIGVSSFPSPSGDGHSLYRDADAALYWSKRHGRTSVVVYEPVRHGAQREGRSVDELSEAIGIVLETMALRPVYQPIFSLTDGATVGFEGLVRPAAGAQFADASSLFAAAEAASRTVELDMACLEVVAGGAGRVEPGHYLSVNVSPRTLEAEVFHASDLITLFSRRGIAPTQVVLELTEREEVKDLEQLRRNVAACRKAGFRLAADDVGAGNAGLRLLSEIHFEIVKVDLSLVQAGATHDPTHAVLRALGELAARWRATIVAEGVETAEELAIIRELGFGAAQGYLLGRPSTTRLVDSIDLDALSNAGLFAEATRRAQATRQAEAISGPAATERRGRSHGRRRVARGGAGRSTVEQPGPSPTAPRPAPSAAPRRSARGRSGG